MVGDFCVRYQASGKDVKVTPSTGKKTWGRMFSLGDLWENMDLRNEHQGEYAVDTDGQMTKTGAVVFCQLLKTELSKLFPHKASGEAETDSSSLSKSIISSVGKFPEDQGDGRVRAPQKAGPKYRNNTPPRYRRHAGPKFRDNTPPAFLGPTPEVGAGEANREQPIIGKGGLLEEEEGVPEVRMKEEPVDDGEEILGENEDPEYYPWKW